MADAQPEPQQDPAVGPKTVDELPECCRTGYLAEGTPTGSETVIGGIPTYVARPAEPSSKAIVIITDIFGWKFLNARLLADEFAKECAFNVYVPDLMDGHSLPVEVVRPFEEKPTTLLGSLTRPFRVIGAAGSAISVMWSLGDAKVVPLIETFFKAINDPDGTEKITRVGVQGYCWGGRFCAITTIRGLAHAMAVAHPSRIEVPGHIEQIRVPTLWICAENDFTFPNPKYVEQTKAILARNNVPGEFHLFPGTKHGFAVRGNEDDPVVVQAKKDALAAGIKFFKSVL